MYSIIITLIDGNLISSSMYEDKFNKLIEDINDQKSLIKLTLCTMPNRSNRTVLVPINNILFIDYEEPLKEQKEEFIPANERTWGYYAKKRVFSLE